MIYKFVPSEMDVPAEEGFLVSNAVRIRVDSLEDVIFIKVPKDIDPESLSQVDVECSRVFGNRKYIILSDTIKFVKLEEEK